MKSTVDARRTVAWLVSLGLAAVTMLAAPQAHATSLPLGTASDYAVLYFGFGGHTLQIGSNVTINGNIGVGGGPASGFGNVHNSGPSTITGRVDFVPADNFGPGAAPPGEFSTTMGNVGPTSVNRNVAAVLNTLFDLSALSQGLSGGTSITLSSGAQTVMESDGQLSTFGGVTFRMFNVTSYSQTDGNVLTIIGDGSGNPVVLNFANAVDVDLKGAVTLVGLTPDQVLYNFKILSRFRNISLNTNASSFPAAFQGVILAPNDALSMTNANLNGRFFGGTGNADMQIVSGSTINSPPPEQQVLNAELSGLPDPATFAFDPTPVEDGPAGTFFFTAQFCNIGAKQLMLLKSVTTSLTGGNVLLSRDDGTPLRSGSVHSFPATQGFADGVLSAGECVDVPYEIGLATDAQFEFLVDVVGVAR